MEALDSEIKMLSPTRIHMAKINSIFLILFKVPLIIILFASTFKVFTLSLVFSALALGGLFLPVYVIYIATRPTQLIVKAFEEHKRLLNFDFYFFIFLYGLIIGGGVAIEGSAIIMTESSAIFLLAYALPLTSLAILYFILLLTSFLPIKYPLEKVRHTKGRKNVSYSYASGAVLLALLSSALAFCFLLFKDSADENYLIRASIATCIIQIITILFAFIIGQSLKPVWIKRKKVLEGLLAFSIGCSLVILYLFLEKAEIEVVLPAFIADNVLLGICCVGSINLYSDKEKDM